MFWTDIEAFVIFFAIDGVFQVVDINIGIEYYKGDEIGQENVPEGCPKGDFDWKDIR
jgi:hypothetical protein